MDWGTLFVPSISCLGLSPDGAWFAFVAKENGQDFIYTRSQRMGQAFKITNISGSIDEIMWINSSQFAYRTTVGTKQRLFVTNYSGSANFDFSPPDLICGSIIENQAAPWKTRNLYFSWRRAGEDTEKLYTISIPTEGELRQFDPIFCCENKLGVKEWIFDSAGRLLGGVARRGSDDVLYLTRCSEIGDQISWINSFVAKEEQFPTFSGFASPAGKILAFGYLGSTNSSIALFDTATHSFSKPVLGIRGFNVQATVFSADREKIDALVAYDKRRSTVMVSNKAKHLKGIITKLLGIENYTPLMFSADYSAIIVSTQSDREAPRFWYVDISENKVFLFYDMNMTLPRALPQKMGSISIVARDGLQLPCYFTPARNASTHHPLFILIPGGPYMGIHRAWSPLIQTLAVSGNDVISMNYRGSRGFNKQFFEAGIGQAGTRMVDDVEDTIRFVRRQYPDRPIILLGISFGGYLALKALEKGPEAVQAVVLINPLLDIDSFFSRAILSGASTEEAAYQRWMWYGQCDALERIMLNRKVSGMKILFIQSSNDSKMLLEIGETFSRELRSNGADVSFVEVSDSHEIVEPNSWGKICSALLEFASANAKKQ